MIRAAVFDADGTLLDSMRVWEEAGARYLTGLGIAPEEGLSRILFPMTLEEGGAYLRERYSLAAGAGEVAAGVLRVVEDFYRYEAGLKNGAAGFLERLREKKIPMAVASSGDRELLSAALERLGVSRYFEAVLTCSELQTSKRRPDIYLAAARRLGTDAARTAVFEDALHALEAARGAGFVTVAVEDAASVNDREKIRAAADLYMDDLSDFESFWRLASEK